MKDYFFIPATKLHKLDSISDDCIKIIDFEDSILFDEIEYYMDALKKVPDYMQYWYRVPIRNSYDEKITLNHLNAFVKIGIKNIIIPKLKTKNEFVEITKIKANLSFILLVEHPLFLIELKSVLKNKKLISSIIAIGIGTHDYLTFMKSSEDSANFNFIRLQLLNIGKAYGVDCLDYASMNIKNEDEFKRSINNTYKLGFDGKFLVHPIQKKWVDVYFEQTQKEETEWAKRIISHLPAGSSEDIEPFIIDGEIIEKPHVRKALNILNNETK
ncbi:hypothetical protein K8354_09670 [Polaribacter litorisediminis]|uniref:aldolase/citrate lyase family protein n=1 Tax=Polaribacter litorisediminis TaxID=1908341 RepID=UPI001CBA83D4|nr:aldolase/citrate lyase family protein [Polaribacter litorisediminis]UAM96610.1 hypothetical protein K8354_09670 [Polaribacter litorisediminis]